MSVHVAREGVLILAVELPSCEELGYADEDDPGYRADLEAYLQLLADDLADRLEYQALARALGALEA